MPSKPRKPKVNPVTVLTEEAKRFASDISDSGGSRKRKASSRYDSDLFDTTGSSSEGEITPIKRAPHFLLLIMLVHDILLVDCMSREYMFLQALKHKPSVAGYFN